MDSDAIEKWLRDGGEYQAADIMKRCRFELEYIDTAFPMGDGEPIDVCNIVIRCPRSIYSEIAGRLQGVVTQIENAVNECSGGYGEAIQQVRWIADPDLPSKSPATPIDSMQAIALSNKINGLIELMISYVTDERDESQPSRYHEKYVDCELLLDEVGLTNPNPHRSLESFWEHCKRTDLGTWASRRAYVKDLYSDLLLLLEKAKKLERTPRNWKRTNDNLDDLEPVRSQWAKARRYIYSSTPDYENGVKEALNSVESAVRILSGDNTITLGKGVKRMGIDEDVGRLMSQAYGLVSNRHSVRHGGTASSGLELAEAEFFLELSAICITYMKQKNGA